MGDDDQSIYSWRGAEIKNFLTFDRIYKNCKVFKPNKIIGLQKIFRDCLVIQIIQVVLVKIMVFG